MINDIKVSIIIPIYNMEQYLGECLESVFGQTLKEIEVICVDDGSTDKTLEILHSYQKRYSNIIVISQQRQGPAVARNEALKKAKGEYVAFMDSDDYYPNDNVLQMLYSTAKQSDVLACGGSMQSNREGEIKEFSSALRKKSVFEKKEIISFEEYQYCYGYTRFIFNRDMLLKNNIIFPLYIRNQDPIFMARALAMAKKIATISEMVYVARVFDKKLCFENRRVILDVAKGFYDLMEFANRNQYQKMQELILAELKNWKDRLWLHIYKGNIELWDVLIKIDKLLLSDEMRKQESYFMNRNMDQITKYIEQKMRYEQELKKQITQYSNIIIYGAGKIGKSVFDFLEPIESVSSINFAVTNSDVNGTARNRKIHCINEYSNSKNEVLVIVAGEQKNSEEMMQNAIIIGFKHIVVVNKVIMNIESYEIKNGSFAV